MPLNLFFYIYFSIIDYDKYLLRRVDFIKHPLEKPHVHQAEDYRPPEGDFEGLTNYRKDFDRKLTFHFHFNANNNCFMNIV